jgi:hypothetical protein
MRRGSVVTYREHLAATLQRAQLPLIAGAVLPNVGSLVLLLGMFGISASRATSPEFVQEIVREVGREMVQGLPYRALFAARIYLLALGAVAAYGAPAYALLAWCNRANWLTAALVGIAPGIAAFLVGIYPSGRLANANYTVGPLVMLCGVFVALATHALVLEAASESTTRSAARSSMFRRLSRVFVVAAILGQVWSLFVVHTPPGQDFAALQVVGDIAAYVAPFVLAAFGLAFYSYHLAPRPRGAAPIVEMVVLLGVGAVLLEPAVRVLRM